MFFISADPVRLRHQVAQSDSIAGVLKDTHDASLYFHVFATGFLFLPVLSEPLIFTWLSFCQELILHRATFAQVPVLHQCSGNPVKRIRLKAALFFPCHLYILCTPTRRYIQIAGHAFGTG